MKYPFEDFLRDKHAEEYKGLDDDMEEDFEAWLVNLEGEDYISYGNQALNMSLGINKTI